MRAGLRALLSKMRDVKNVTIYTDGSCLGNPGPGGWAAILQYHGREREMVGSEPNTTNNRMEMMAAVEALRALKEPCQVELHSDSQYLINAFEKRWVDKWRANGWLTASKQPVKNVDLWNMLEDLTQKHRVKFRYVAGHSGHEFNERCDKLARDAATRLASQPVAT